MRLLYFRMYMLLTNYIPFFIEFFCYEGMYVPRYNTPFKNESHFHLFKEKDDNFGMAFD